MLGSAAWDGAFFFFFCGKRGDTCRVSQKTEFHREASTSHHFISHGQVEVCKIPFSISLSGLVSLGLACLCLYLICSLADSTFFFFKQVVVAAAATIAARKCYFPHLFPHPLIGDLFRLLSCRKGKTFAALCRGEMVRD